MERLCCDGPRHHSHEEVSENHREQRVVIAIAGKCSEIPPTSFSFSSTEVFSIRIALALPPIPIVDLKRENIDSSSIPDSIRPENDCKEGIADCDRELSQHSRREPIERASFDREIRKTTGKTGEWRSKRRANDFKKVIGRNEPLIAP